jgi:hypothetical protein
MRSAKIIFNWPVRPDSPRIDSRTVTIAYTSGRGTLKPKVENVNVQGIRESTAKIHEAICSLHTLVAGRQLKPVTSDWWPTLLQVSTRCGACPQ